MNVRRSRVGHSGPCMVPGCTAHWKVKKGYAKTKDPSVVFTVDRTTIALCDDHALELQSQLSQVLGLTFRGVGDGKYETGAK